MAATETDELAWDLDPLVDGEGAAGCDRLIDDADERAAAFAATYAGKVAELDGAGLVTAMDELATIYELVMRAGSYASLRFAVDQADPANGALIAHVQERGTAVETTLLFFELEWAALDDEQAETLLSADGLDTSRHYLRTARRYRPHLLSEPEERIMTEKSVTGRSSWGRLFGELLSATKVTVGDEEPVALDVALSRLASPDREVRKTNALAVTEALKPGLRVRAFIANTLMADKATDDRLRDYPTWISSRNLANEASDESVAALVETVRGAFDIPQRWYKLKATLLGVDQLVDYDRMAALPGGGDSDIPYEDARDLVLTSFSEFSPVLGDTARRFFDERWIDVPVRPAKRGGAFCSYTVPSVHPYVMLNYTARRRDVLTLAHELGHGLHAALAIPRGVLEQHTPLTVCETASVFGETLVFNRLLDQESDPQSRLSLLASALDDSVATVFRQTAMHVFEDLAHTARRDEGELSIERFGELWEQSQGELLGDAVQITEGYRSWWSYIPHFINTPGYVYAYAYGKLLALSVYARYMREGEAFVPQYLELLSAGGSRSPEDLAAIAGLDLADPGFWAAGIELVRDQLTAAEEAAAQVNIP